jgi:hypothetical protein
MSYDRFRAAITAPNLITVATHWQDVRGDRLMPAWSDIDAVALRHALPMIWAWRYDAGRKTFMGRLAGEEVAAVVGGNVRNRPIEECFSATSVPVIRARLEKILAGPCFMHGAGTVYVRHGYTGSGERVALPLASDGIHADGVLGATLYRFGIKPAAEDPITFDPEEETIEFFPLGE